MSILTAGSLVGSGPPADSLSTDSEPPVPTIDTRRLDEVTDEELRDAWKNDPVAAKQHFSGTRFRFQAAVIDVSPSGATIFTLAGPASITFRDESHLRRLVKSRGFDFEATVEQY